METDLGVQLVTGGHRLAVRSALHEDRLHHQLLIGRPDGAALGQGQANQHSDLQPPGGPGEDPAQAGVADHPKARQPEPQRGRSLHRRGRGEGPDADEAGDHVYGISRQRAVLGHLDPDRLAKRHKQKHDQQKAEQKRAKEQDDGYPVVRGECPQEDLVDSARYQQRETGGRRLDTHHDQEESGQERTVSRADVAPGNDAEADGQAQEGGQQGEVLEVGEHPHLTGNPANDCQLQVQAQGADQE